MNTFIYEVHSPHVLDVNGTCYLMLPFHSCPFTSYPLLYIACCFKQFIRSYLFYIFYCGSFSKDGLNTPCKSPVMFVLHVDLYFFSSFSCLEQIKYSVFGFFCSVQPILNYNSTFISFLNKLSNNCKHP